LAAACAVLFLASLLFLAPRVHAALYIGTDSISRANLDGSLFDARFIETDGGSVCAIAVDSSHVYWADSYDNTIGRANLDGTSVENNFISLAKSTLPCGLAVDSGFIYWPNMGTDTIGRARIDGSQIDESFIPTAQHPCAVAVNQTGLYWASDDEDEIWRTDIAGVNAPEIVIDEGATDSCGLALAGPHLFWVESVDGTIGRANLDGSEPLPAFITGGHYPVSLVTQGGQLYWVNADWGFESIGRADLDGKNVNQALISGLKYPYALAADSTQIVPRPPAPPKAPSALKFGKLRRQQDGSVVFPVDLPGDGWLEAEVRGAKVKVQPEGVEGGAVLGAGRKWLKITPTAKRGNGSRCVLRAFRRGAKVKLELQLRFTETGKSLLYKSRPFLLFKPRQVAVAKRQPSKPPVSCSSRGGRISVT
jgi:sugar lactone lactonase YvrE